MAIFKRKSSARIETVLGNGTEVKGEIRVQGTVRIDGALEGDVRADWVVVGEGGRISGNVAARGVVVGGAVEGNILSDEIVELQKNGRIVGEIRTAKLVVAEGAAFDGQSRMKTDPAREEDAEGRVISLKPPAASS